MKMNKAQRERAMLAAGCAYRQLPNGPVAGQMREASIGHNEAMLRAVWEICKWQSAATRDEIIKKISPADR